MADINQNNSTPAVGSGSDLNSPSVPSNSAPPSGGSSYASGSTGSSAGGSSSFGETGTAATGASSGGTGAAGAGHTAEARSRFTAAMEEAKAGAAALGAEARERAGAYRDQARSTSGTWSNDARTKAGDLAVEGKTKASEALSSLSRIVSDNAGTVDEKLGSQYGDYVRTASKSLQTTADRLNEKSVDELSEDARQFVRNSPGMAVGMAALAGYMFARILRR